MLRWELNWSALFYSLGWLSVLVTAAGVLYGLLMLMLIAVEDACGKYDNSVTRWINSKHATPRARRKVRQWVPMTAMLIVGYVLGAAGIFSPIHELHNVLVLKKLDNRVYSVIVPAQGKAKVDRREVFRLCPEGDDLPLMRGMVIEPFQYVQGKDCLLITDDTYVDWQRDSHDNVVIKEIKDDN